MQRDKDRDYKRKPYPYPYIGKCFNNNQCFGAFHCNIRSISANIDNLQHLLSELSSPFSLIGITETKLKANIPPTTNIEIQGYYFVSEPSLSNAGGVAFYIKNSLDFSIRSNISSTTNDFETLWLEVSNGNHSNLLCGVVYRHPNGDLEAFNKYFNKLLTK